MVLLNNKWYVAPLDINGGILLPILLIVFLVPIIRQISKKKIQWQKDLLWGCFLLYLGLLLSITIFPIYIFGQSSPVYKIGFGKQVFINLSISSLKEYLPIQLLGNVLLLTPFSFFMALHEKKFTKWLPNFLGLFLISLTIEFSQLILNYFYLGDRVFDINDLLLNSIGGLLGLGAYKIVNKFFKSEVKIFQK